MKLLQTLINRKLIIGLLCIFILLIGSYSINKLDVELMPDITFNTAMIDIYAGEMTASDVEELITTPIEQRISSIKEIDSYESVSAIGYSNITVNFESGDSDEAYKEMENMVNSMAQDLPGVDDIYFSKLGMGGQYDYFLDVYGGDMREMSSFVQNVLKPRLEALPEVGDVLVFGSTNQEVLITLKEDELEEHGVDPSQIVYFLQQEDTNVSLGEFEDEGEFVNLRWNTKITSLYDIETLPIQGATGIIELQDIAEISLADNEATTAGSWKNGDSNHISVQIASSASATAIALSDAVRDEVQQIQDEGLVHGFELEELVSGGDFIQGAITEVSKNVIIGGVLALIVLLVFLRSFRAMMIIGIAIPSSILLTFASMYFLDYSINLMTLIALGLGIGMMVDAAIVILESIYKKLQEGFSRLEATIEGTKEVGTAVIASMLTTIVVFLPIGIMGGEAGEFMVMLATVVVITLVSSVFISFTCIPVLAHSLLKMKEKVEKKESKFIKVYGSIVSWVVKKKLRRWGILLLFFIVFIGSIVVGVSNMQVSLLPDIYERQTEVFLLLDKGVTPDGHSEIAEAVHEGLKDLTDVEDYLILSMANDTMYGFVNMTPAEEATITQAQVNENIREFLDTLKDDYPIMSTSMMDLYGAGSPVQVQVKGQDLDTILSKANEVQEGLEDIEGLYDIGHSMENVTTEKQFLFDHDKVKEHGLIPSQIREQIQLATTKQPIGQVVLDGKQLPIMLNTEGDIDTVSELDNIDIETPTETEKLSTFVLLETVNSPVEINHHNGERVVTIHANYDGQDLGSINQEVQAMIKDINQTDVSITVAGDLSEQVELLLDILYIFIIALFLVYVVMAVQFNSLIHPLVVMSIIPMTLVGVILGVVVMNVEFSMMSGMGIVMLIGIVLNNAILLIDRAKQLRQQGLQTSDALIEAGKNRMRPIFITTFTTVAGMLPLAFATGNSSAYQVPMATVVISGLLFATVITLILVPAVYLIFDDVLGWPKRLREKRKLGKKQAESQTGM